MKKFFNEFKEFAMRGNIMDMAVGIIVGAAVDILWLAFLAGTGIYEIIPGFIASLVVAIVVSKLSKAPGKEVEQLFDEAVALED